MYTKGRPARAALLVSVLTAVACAPSAPPDLKSAEVVIPMLDSMRVSLENGEAEVYEDGSLVWRAGLTDWVLPVDADADGDEDALAVTFDTGAGSGVFYSLTLFTLDGAGWRSPGAWTWRSSVGLGDRVRVRAATVDRAAVELHLTEHGPDDPLCCPTLETVRRWRIDPDALRLEPTDDPPTTGDAG